MKITRNNYFGVVAKCKHASIGVITNCLIPRGLDKKDLFTGVTLDGKNWQSTSPTYLAKHIEEHIQKREDNAECQE